MPEGEGYGYDGLALSSLPISDHGAFLRCRGWKAKNDISPLQLGVLDEDMALPVTRLHVRLRRQK